MILISGGMIVTPQRIFQSDLLIEGGKIRKIGRRLDDGGAEIINAQGLHLLPGAIDPHVHFRDPENVAKEDFFTGSSSALAGGVTTIMDMPNYRNPPTTSIAAYNEKRKIASGKAVCDYQLRFGATNSNSSEAAKSNAPSLKVFLSETHSELNCSYMAAVRHFKAFPRHKPICVHAEDRERIASRAGKFKSQSMVQDKMSSQMASEFALRQAGRLERRVHLCHLTTALEIQLCRRFKNATFEVTPNHLFLSALDIRKLGKLGKINPPLRDKKEQSALWRCIGNDTIIASDHAPHLLEHKLQGAPGFPGVGTLLPLMLDAAAGRRIPLQLLSRICSLNAAKAFGLQGKGLLAAGFDADIVLADLKKEWKVTAENRLSKCGWTPFEGRKLRGSIEKVLLRGSLAFDGESVLSKKGSGRELS